MTHIYSLRCHLRPFNDDDFHNLRKLDSDAEIMKFTPAKIPQTVDQTRARLERYSNMDGVWAAELKDTSDFVGWFMLIKTDLEFPEIGFMIVKDFWGKGLATEIGREIIAHAFNECGHSGLAARTNADNVAQSLS